MVERRHSSAAERAQGGGNYFTAPNLERKFFSTGCKLLDLALGGGWCEERVSNIIGDKSTGKTLLAIEASANFIRKYPRGKVLYREREFAFDKQYAAAVGMPLKSVDFGKGISTVEDMFEEWQRLTNRTSSQPILYIVDSLDALTDRAEQKRKIDKGSYGASKAAMMSELFRRLIEGVSSTGMTVLIISQMRDNIAAAQFGRKWTRSGGRAMDFYASIVLVLALVGKIIRQKEKIERVTGVHIRAYCDKNKITQPYRSAEFDIRFGWGMDDVGACLDWLKQSGGLGNILGGMKEPAYLAMMENRSGAWERALADLHTLVERRWFEIETSFLPSKRKYG